jgi:hypothetical protein
MMRQDGKDFNDKSSETRSSPRKHESKSTRRQQPLPSHVAGWAQSRRAQVLVLLSQTQNDIASPRFPPRADDMAAPPVPCLSPLCPVPEIERGLLLARPVLSSLVSSYGLRQLASLVF